MTVVGFDVAKISLVGAVLNSNGAIVLEGCTVENTDEALRVWLADLKSKTADDLLAACESTSYYHYPLLRVVDELGIPCRVINPLMTKQATKATVRGKKTDKSDAILIAKLGLQGEGQLHTAADTSGKQLQRTAANLGTIAGMISNIQESMQERQILLPALATKQLKAAIDELRKAALACEETAAESMDRHLITRLTSIPGVGVHTARILVAEIGDMTRFSGVDKLMAFSGLDPRVRQSGTSLHRNTRLTKRGSPYLRRALFLSANITRQHDPEVKAYYQKKRDEGRTYTEAMMPVCRKLLARVHAVWMREEKYVKRIANGD
jgi:transposase